LRANPFPVTEDEISVDFRSLLEKLVGNAIQPHIGGGLMAAVDRPALRKRPVYLNLFAIRLPFPAFVSILHRVSGALLFLLGIPLLLLTVRNALASPEAWAAMRESFGSPWIKLVTLVLAWAYLHHLFAGIRHLAMDMHIGMDLKSARQSAVVAFVLALLVTLAVAVRLW